MAAIIAVFQWKINQIKNETRHDTVSTKDIHENHKDINQLKELVVSLQSKISDLCDRISRLEGAWNQHNRENNK